MITQDQIEQLSSKYRLAIARPPETVHGFLSLEDANTALATHDLNFLVNVLGLGGISDGRVVFLAGESTYGFPLLESMGFAGMLHRLPSRVSNAADPHAENDVMRTAEDFLRRYFSDCVHLNSMQELLHYLNHSTLPRDGRTVAKTMGL